MDLKAALYSKQREVASERKPSHDSDATGIRKVSDKVCKLLTCTVDAGFVAPLLNNNYSGVGVAF